MSEHNSPSRHRAYASRAVALEVQGEYAEAARAWAVVASRAPCVRWQRFAAGRVSRCRERARRSAGRVTY